MRPKYLFAFVFICFPAALTLFNTVNAAAPPTDNTVWQWYADCSSPRRIKAEVIFRHKKIYTTTFSICRFPGTTLAAEDPQRILQFNLISPHRSLFGEHKGERLEGNLWQAGGDNNGVVLGVSFAGPKRIWCNTLHILDPEKRSETIVAPGLIVRTEPAVDRRSID